MTNSSISEADFEAIKDLGCGSFGKVQLVRKIDDQKLYAMKSVLLSRLNQKQKDNALNEVRLLASIKAPYVISYKGSFFNNETQSLCVIMEYADGGDLQNMIYNRNNEAGEGFEEVFIWKIAFEILHALNSLHQNNIVHRDIKSGNIFFANGIAKVGDLNVSKVLELGWCETQTGTPYYISPQIWNGSKYTSKCDIWALGCVIYEMCELKTPFRATDFPSLFRKVIVGEYEQISNKYSHELKDLIRQCLTVDDELRMSAAELLETPTLSGLQLSLEAFRHQEEQIDLLDPIKCPRVLKFLNSRLPKNQFQLNSSKKNVCFVTKKQIEKESNKEKNGRTLRKILSEKIIKVDQQENNKNKNVSKKHIKLPPLQKQVSPLEPLHFTVKKLKVHTKPKLGDKENKENRKLLQL